MRLGFAPDLHLRASEACRARNALNIALKVPRELLRCDLQEGGPN